MLPDHRLPLFPLGLVLYPSEPVPLHIFEPRYREMTQVCLETGRPFGVLYASEAGVAEVGCTAHVRRVVQRYDDGRLDVVVVGDARFRTLAIHRDFPYLTAETEPVSDLDRPAAGVDETRQRVIAQHMRLLEMAGEPLHPSRYEAHAQASFVIGQNAGLDLDQKQALLQMRCEADRLAFLAAHFKEMLARVERVRHMHHLARGDGHTGEAPEL